MTADQLSRPVLGALAAGLLLSIWGAPSVPAAHPKAAGRPPPALPAVSGTAILDNLDRLHERLEIHVAYAAGRDSWLYVGTHPLPKPRRWR